MGRIFYPDSTVKLRTHVVEQLQKPDQLHSIDGSQDLSSQALAAVVWNKVGWEAKRVSLRFDGGVSKDYGIHVLRGRGIISGKNDTLHFKIDGYSERIIALDEGFYSSGTDLAANLKTKLDADVVLGTAPPWTVTYNSASGLFKILNAVAFQYFHINSNVPIMRSRSTAGNLFGFTQNSLKGTIIQSDTVVPGIGTAFTVDSGSATTVQDVLITDPVAMTLDNALRISSAACPTTIHYEVVYRTMDV